MFPRRLRTFDLNPMMAPPRELDIKRMVEACESNSFDENSGSFVALKWVGTEGTPEFNLNFQVSFNCWTSRILGSRLGALRG